MSTIGTFLRPNIIEIDRRERGAQGPTGEYALTTVEIVSGVPARIDVTSIVGRSGGDYVAEIEGEVFVATHLLFLDGIAPYVFGSTPPGGTFDYQPAGATAPLPYIVAGDGRGAYIDVEPGDRVTDENGVTYLALAVATYYDINPQRQVRLSQGRAWSG